MSTIRDWSFLDPPTHQPTVNPNPNATPTATLPWLWIPHRPHILTSSTVQTALYYLHESLWALLACSIILLTLRAYTLASHRSSRSYFRRRTDIVRVQRYATIWQTRRPWVLSLFMDQWLRGLIPGNGIWRSAAARSLRRKEDTWALRQLVRLGIYPLYIQDGGTGTQEDGAFGFGAWGLPRWPWYRQSKRRAVFEFVVPRARGWMLPDARVVDEEEIQRRADDTGYMEMVRVLLGKERYKRFRRATRWRVCATGIMWLERDGAVPPTYVNGHEEEVMAESRVAPSAAIPYEVGAEGIFEPVLPFQSDRVLVRGRGTAGLMPLGDNLGVDSTLLTISRLPIIRIEAPDSGYIELDKELLILAQQLGLTNGWDEEFAQLHLREAYREIGEEPLE